MFKNSVSTTNISDIKYRSAKVPLLHDNIRVVVGSEELIFNETFLTCLVSNNRVVKIKKSALEFAQ